MNAKSLIFFFVCLNLAGVIMASLVAENVLAMEGYREVLPYDREDIENMFNPFKFSVTNVVYGVIGVGIAGLIGFITRQGAFAVSAAVIWILGIFLNIISWFTNGFNIMMGIILPAEIGFMQYVFSAITTLIFFWFLAGTLTQRPDLG